MTPGATNGGVPHFLDLSGIAPRELRLILDYAAALKRDRRLNGRFDPARPLAGKVLAMIFDKPSTRTRISFDVGMRELGGETLMLTGAEMQLGRGESIADTARVMSRYVDIVMMRILSDADLADFAANASVPVINGLTKTSHPCQVMADLLTFEEHRGSDPGAHGRLERRQQQRARELGPCRPEIRFHDQCREPPRASAGARHSRPGPRPTGRS